LAPSEEEIAGLVAGYEDYQAGIETLYAVPETRYASPALIFNAAPVFADWAHCALSSRRTRPRAARV